MFTGIIESLGEIVALTPDGTNRHLEVRTPLASELRVDQSVSHNGVCLTVTEVRDETYRVTAIQETLQKSNLGSLQPGDKVNLERCMLAGGRFDGHIVQGHVDQTGTCQKVQEQDGSWLYTFTLSAHRRSVPSGRKGFNYYQRREPYVFQHPRPGLHRSDHPLHLRAYQLSSASSR